MSRTSRSRVVARRHCLVHSGPSVFFGVENFSHAFVRYYYAFLDEGID